MDEVKFLSERLLCLLQFIQVAAHVVKDGLLLFTVYASCLGNAKEVLQLLSGKIDVMCFPNFYECPMAIVWISDVWHIAVNLVGCYSLLILFVESYAKILEF